MILFSNYHLLAQQLLVFIISDSIQHYSFAYTELDGSKYCFVSQRFN